MEGPFQYTGHGTVLATHTHIMAVKIWSIMDNLHQQKDLSIIFEYIYYNVLTDGQIYISLIHTLIRLYISIP